MSALSGPEIERLIQLLGKLPGIKVFPGKVRSGFPSGNTAPKKMGT